MFITHAFQNVALLLFPCCFLAIAILHLLNNFCCHRCMFKTVAAHAETISLTCYSFIGSSARETNCSNLKNLGSRYAAKLQYPCREPQIFLLSTLSNCIERFLSISPDAVMSCDGGNVMEPDCILETEGIFSMVQGKNVHSPGTL